MPCASMSKQRGQAIDRPDRFKLRFALQHISPCLFIPAEPVAVVVAPLDPAAAEVIPRQQMPVGLIIPPFQDRSGQRGLLGRATFADLLAAERLQDTCCHCHGLVF